MQRNLSTEQEHAEKAVNAVDDLVFHFEMGYDQDSKKCTDAALHAMSYVMLKTPIELRAVTFRSFLNVLEERGYNVTAAQFMDNL